MRKSLRLLLPVAGLGKDFLHILHGDTGEELHVALARSRLDLVVGIEVHACADDVLHGGEVLFT